MDTYIQTNTITLHALDLPGGAPTIVYLPGLTANAYLFGGVAAALDGRYRILALDLRGRGLSDKPVDAYTMADHAGDVLGVLDDAGIERATLVGHSFGGLLSLYLASRHSARVERIVVIDAGKAATEPRVVEQIRPSLDRLGVVLPSVNAYLAAMQKMPFLDGYWDDALEAYFRADMNVRRDGSAQPHSTPAAIGAAIDGILAEDWTDIIAGVRCPALLINATGPYGPAGAPPILSAEQAQETVALLPDCRYVHVPGNHVTMVFGDNAALVAGAIVDFVG